MWLVSWLPRHLNHGQKAGHGLTPRAELCAFGPASVTGFAARPLHHQRPPLLGVSRHGWADGKQGNRRQQKLPQIHHEMTEPGSFNKSTLTVKEVKVMHIPPKPFRDRAMKMSTDRAGRKREARHLGATAELQEGPAPVPCGEQADWPAGVRAGHLGSWDSLFLATLLFHFTRPGLLLQVCPHLPFSINRSSKPEAHRSCFTENKTTGSSKIVDEPS